MSRITRTYGDIDQVAPNAPGSITAQALSSVAVFVEWTPVTDPSGVSYQIERAPATGSFVVLVAQSAVTYTDAVQRGQTYRYRVRAVDGAGNVSGYSPTATVTTAANSPPAWVTSPILPAKSAQTAYTFTLTASDSDADPITFPTITGLPPGATATVQAQSGNTRSILISGTGLAAGTYSFTIGADDGYGGAPPPTGSADWATRKSQPGVIWAHRFESLSELQKAHNAADNGDLASPNVLGVSADAVCPHIVSQAVEPDGVQCLEITQIGGELAAPLATAPVTVLVYPGAVLTPTSASRATLSLPLTDSNGVVTTALGISNPLSGFKIDSGTSTSDYDGYFLDIATTPVEGATLTFSVGTATATPFTVGNILTGISIQHVKCKDLNNPYQTIVIDEHVSELGGETWPSPTGWVPGGPVPADAYLTMLHYRTTVNGQSVLYKDKCTVVKKQSNTPSAGLTTLTIRRATVGHGDAGRMENQVINRYYPCDFPTGTLVGNDVTGGWNRPLAPLIAGDNGLATADPAANNTLTRRQMFQGATKISNYRSGYFGHADYHNVWDAANPFTPNTVASNGVLPFVGDEFYLCWKQKYSSSVTTRSEGKMFFLDQYQTPDQAQIVGLYPDNSRLWWKWFHNYGVFPWGLGSADEGIQDTWGQPLNKWFALKMHMRAGHDNDYEYGYERGPTGAKIANSVTVAQVSRDDVAQTMTIDCTHMPFELIKQGMTRNMDGTADPVAGLVGTYWASTDNPEGRDPKTGGYFGPLDSSVTTDKNWEITFSDGPPPNSPTYGPYKIAGHTAVGGNSRYVLVKRKPSDPAWPDGAPDPLPAGLQVKIAWIDSTTSSRYRDSEIELWKREEADADWVLVSRMTRALLFNMGVSPLSAGNPPGWNEWMPTGYSNIDDNSAPGSRTIWSRVAEVILSTEDIAAPTLP
jgi:hypothetical protein